MQLYEVYSSSFAAYSGINEVLNGSLHLKVRHRAHGARHMVAALNLARRSNRLAYTFLRELHERWCHFVERLHYVRLTLDYGQEHWQRVHAGSISLPTGMVQLDSQLGTMSVYTLYELAHRLDMVIVAHGQLRERAGCVHIIYSAYSGYYETHAAFGSLFIIIHQHLGGFSVWLSKAEFRCSHNRAVLDL